MTYDHSVPEQSNLVRGVSGDLAKMRGNFEHLAPAASGILTSGTTPDAALRGWVFGDDLEAQRFRLLVSGADGGQLRIQEFDGSWADVFTFAQSGLDSRSHRALSGVTPTVAAHLATKGYVDAMTLDALAGVDVGGAVSGDVLRFDGTNWVDSRTQLAQLSDTALVSPASGEVLAYDGVQWVNSGLNFVTALSALSDVTLTAPASGEILTYDGAEWINGPAPVGDHGALTGLTDDDHPQYSLADGTRPFTGTVSGITPTLPAHLATKGYVDGLAAIHRAKGERTATQSFASATSGDISFTAADLFDVSGWHDPGAGAPGDTQFTVPTGGSGIYLLTAFTRWAAPTSGMHVLLRILQNTAALPERADVEVPVGTIWAGSVEAIVEADEGDVFTVTATQTSQDAAAVNLAAARFAVCRLDHLDLQTTIISGGSGAEILQVQIFS